MKKVILICMLSSSAFADWAVAPDLESRVLWQLVSEDRAEVVSSVSYGSPNGEHSKQTVFKIIKASKDEGPIEWAIKPDGTYRVVMCEESWLDRFTYYGSSCSISGCIPDNEACIKEITITF